MPARRRPATSDVFHAALIEHDEGLLAYFQRLEAAGIPIGADRVARRLADLKASRCAGPFYGWAIAAVLYDIGEPRTHIDHFATYVVHPDGRIEPAA